MKRIDHFQTSPEAFKHLAAATGYLAAASLDQRLRVLVEIRVSQINGCVYCLDLHTKQARQLGETQQRLDLLPIWHEAPCFDERERAALAWAESLTHVSTTHAPDEVYENLTVYFSEKEIVDVSLAIALMNAWNRLGIGFRKMPA